MTSTRIAEEKNTSLGVRRLKPIPTINQLGEPSSHYLQNKLVGKAIVKIALSFHINEAFLLFPTIYLFLRFLSPTSLNYLKLKTMFFFCCGNPTPLLDHKRGSQTTVQKLRFQTDSLSTSKNLPFVSLGDGLALWDGFIRLRNRSVLVE